MKLFSAVAIAFMLAIGSEYTFSQNDTLRAAAGDKWLISARAGGVNYVEGDVGIVRANGRSGRLIKGDSVEIGDRVSTGTTGKAEILLNPGSYIRIAGDTAFEFVTTSLDDLRLKVDRGSAILEIYASRDFKVNVETPAGPVIFENTGVYRLDVQSDAKVRLEVWKGKVELGKTAVKSGKAVLLGGSEVAIAKFDRDEQDAFETWSRNRARDLARSVADVQKKAFRPVLINSYLDGEWNLASSLGLWIYNPRFASFCFFPFGWGWYSPYGFALPSSMWWYQMSQYILWRDRMINGSGNTGGSGTTTSGPPTGTGGQPRQTPPSPSGESRIKRPPFIDMQPPTSSPPIIEFPGAESRGGGAAPPMKGASPASPPVFSPQPSAPTTVPMDRPSPVRVKGDN